MIPTTSVFLPRSRTAKKSPSPTIPIPNSQLPRSYSDIQLENDKKMYEWRDGIMYYRLLTGMVQRHQEVGYHPKINRSVENLMKTQASPVSDDGFTSGSSSSSNSNEGRFIHESSCSDEQQVDSRYPFLAHSQPRPREGLRRVYSSLDPKWCSNSQGVTQSCPEQDDSNGDDGVMFRLDL